MQKGIFEKVKEVVLPSETLAYNIIIRTDYDAKHGHAVNFQGEVTVNATSEEEALTKAREIIWKRQGDDFPVWHDNTSEKRGDVRVVETITQLENHQDAFLTRAKRISFGGRYYRQENYTAVGGETFLNMTKWSSKDRATHNANAPNSVRVHEKMDEDGSFDIRSKRYSTWNGVDWITHSR